MYLNVFFYTHFLNLMMVKLTENVHFITNSLTISPIFNYTLWTYSNSYCTTLLSIYFVLIVLLFSHSTGFGTLHWYFWYQESYCSYTFVEPWGKLCNDYRYITHFTMISMRNYLITLWHYQALILKVCFEINCKQSNLKFKKKKKKKKKFIILIEPYWCSLT